MQLPTSWARVLREELERDYWRSLIEFVAAERRMHTVLPAESQVFAALEATPYEAVKVLLLGQDPYPTPGHAHGLCFSVMPGIKPPASLLNIYKELQADLGIQRAASGYLQPWAEQGILMLNTVLTVRSGAANSHQGRGWELFTDAIIRAVNAKPEPVVFVLWGNAAQKKLALIDTAKHAVVKGAHPSPLAAKKWFGSKPFSQINAALIERGRTPIDWRVE
jgi:uracil-DNA glycosylase